MGPGLFLIAIMGCGDGDAPCQTVRTLDTRYETQAACTAATGAAVEKASDVDFPVIAAQCVSANGKPQVKADEVKRPGPGQVAAKASPVGI